MARGYTQEQVFTPEQLAEDTARYDALRDELSRHTSDGISYLYEGRDTLGPDDVKRGGLEHEDDDGNWRTASVYGDNELYSDLTEAELNDPKADLLFEPYKDGYLVTRR